MLGYLLDLKMEVKLLICVPDSEPGTAGPTGGERNPENSSTGVHTGG